MKNKLDNYSFFNNFILRTPALSVETWEGWIEEIDKGNLKGLFENKFFLEAVFLASPALYEEIIKYMEGTSSKDEERFKHSVLKYLTRMAWRCTPFGLFAACSVGNLGGDFNIELPLSCDFVRHTRLDMNYLCALAQDVARRDGMRDKLLYTPNSSIYVFGDKLRYVEYRYVKAKRSHKIVSVDNSDFLQMILDKAAGGATIHDLAMLITDDEVSFDEARDFIGELIDNQILVSELEPSVTGSEFLYNIIEVLKRIASEDDLRDKLIKVDSLLNVVDGKDTDYIKLYNEIVDIIKGIGTEFDPRFLFQTDMVKRSDNCNVSEAFIDDLKSYINVLNVLTPVGSGNGNLNAFMEAFYSRYEDKEMPLLNVLDNESGIGYARGKESDIAPLLDNYVIPGKGSQNSYSNMNMFLYRKYLKSVANGDYVIELTDEDFKNSVPNWNNFPSSMSCMCKVFKDEQNNDLVYITSCGGSSAVNLLGRFCHCDEKIKRYVDEIVQREDELVGDDILAEIVHLPESRTGNILLRPALRKYEIPYLAKSAVDMEYRLPLSDLYVSVKGGREIVLRSKRLNKRIFPRLGTAHNYSFNSMDVYHFLCDLQAQGLRGGVGFSWGDIESDYEFLPRVSYGNFILSMAKWKVNYDDLKKLQVKDDVDSVENIRMWRSKIKMPRYVVMSEGDNYLLVDLDKMVSFNMLLNAVKKRKVFILEEFPFVGGRSVSKDVRSETYVNEFLFGFYKVNTENYGKN